jgi:hypothetical protein
MVPPMPGMMGRGRFVARISNRRNAQRAVYAADNAANHTADETTNRSCRLHAHGGAMIDTVGDTLCLRRKRESK